MREQMTPQQALAKTLVPAQPEDELELDELWSFVGSKDNVVWVWIDLCPCTRQVVAWMWDDHSTGTYEMLWRKVPDDYKHCFCFADGWHAYAAIVPPEQLHQQEKKGTTNHLERFNLTLRQRLARFTRKTLSFSKSLFMHLLSLQRFFLRYNEQQARRYNASILI